MAKDFNRFSTAVYHDTLSGDSVMNTGSSGFGITGYDYVGVDTTSSQTQDVYTFRKGGVSGTLLGTLTITYSDSGTKLVITSITKT